MSSRLHKIVGEVWAEVLDRNHIGLDQNFFDLGGDSLKALDVISRVNARLGVELPLIAFFEDPTISHLSEVLAGLQSAQESGEADRLPTDTIRNAIAQVWTQVLKQEDIGPQANFFDIGGDSLKALEVISRLQELLHVDVPLIAFFEDPTITHLAQVVEQSRGSAVEPGAYSSEMPANIEAPLSFGQLQYWLLQQSAGLGHLHSNARVFRLRGEFRVDILKRALSQLCRRHQVLSSRIQPGLEEPAQVVDPDFDIDVELRDLSSLPPDARMPRALQLAQEAWRKTFDLVKEPPLRACLLQLADQDYLLVIIIHHVVSDGNSGSIFFEELATIYDALRKGDVPSFKPLALQYFDYATAERLHMRGQTLEKELTFWRTYLEGAPAYTSLPTDRPRPETHSHAGAKSSVVVPRVTLDGLKELAQNTRSTLFSVLLSSLRVLLYRWTGERDTVIGTVASTRRRAGTDRLIGCFVNFLPFRNRVENDETALDVLEKEKLSFREAFAHQDCPFLEMVRSASASRITDGNPIYNVALLLQNFPEIRFDGEKFTGELIELEGGFALLDLRFIAIERQEGLHLECEFNTEIFNASTIESLLDGFAGVIREIAGKPSKRVAEFGIPATLVAQSETAHLREQPFTIAITSSFTAELVQAPLAFWLTALGVPAKFRFAPYNQVFQQLLDPNSLVSQNRDGFNIIAVRLTDWIRHEHDLADSVKKEKIHAGVRELIDFLRAHPPSAPTFICLCPVEPTHDGDWPAFFASMEQALAVAVAPIPAFHLITSQEIFADFPVENYWDSYTDRLGHVPYTPDFFAALATTLARRMLRISTEAKKVIVVDADGVLWNDSQVFFNDPSHRVLQEVLLQQFEKHGILLCLLSTQSEESIDGLLSPKNGILGPEHFVAQRIGSGPAVSAVRELANELQLPRNGFVFISADERRCNEITTKLPEVLALQLPTDAADIPAFLAHAWTFDAFANVEPDPRFSNVNRAVARAAAEWRDLASIRRAMDAAQVTARKQTPDFVAPRTKVEESVAAAWAQVLKLDRVGVHENFFSLGGHSLSGTQVVARVRQVFGVEIPLRTIFDAPTVAEFSERVEAELKARTDLASSSIRKLAVRDNLPLSFAQQRLWFLDQLDPGNPLYNMTQKMRLRGKLDVSALGQAVNRMIARHEALRTTFALHDREPVQAIAGALDLAVPLVDLSSFPASEREAEIQRRVHEEARLPFDLTAGPVIRAQVLRAHGDDHVLLLTMHHIVSDRWSLGLAASELAEHYQAIVEHRASTLPELAIQYADFAVWQRETLTGELLDGQLRYWKNQLDQAPAVLQLPTDYARPAQMSMRGAWEHRLVPKPLVDKLNALSREHGVTLFMTLLAAFQTLMCRYSGQSDVVIGSPIAGRNFAELEPLIGFFVNTLALRGDLSDDPTFSGLLGRTKEACLGAYAHADIPFEKLVEELQPERSLSHNPIFQVLFAHQNAPMQTLQLPGVEIERTAVHPGTSILDMSWFAMDVPDGILLRVEYSTDLFEADTIARAVTHFTNLLESLAADPNQAVSQLAMLDKAEKDKLLIEFNTNNIAFPSGVCMHNLVEQTAARLPDADAVVCGTQRWTYKELNERANQIAHHLIKLGGGPDVLVGVFLERGPELLPSILGVLKSGSAYVPLDPAYPRERLSAIIADAKAPIVITQQSLRSLVESSGAHCICIDSEWNEIATEKTDNPRTAVRPENIGYVLFTSGSTGRPKGVALEHRSAATFVQWAQTVFSPEELSGVLFSTSVCFDLSIFEMFAPLSVGGKIIVTENALYLPSAESRNEVTLINTVPSAMAELVRSKSVPGSVRIINLAGEALPLSLVNEIYASTPATKVYNLYGPTEDTTYSTYTLTAPNTRVTIGKPLPNSQAYILDSKMNPVPIGVPGELYLAGAGLARGYFGRPDLTQERFIPNPFGSSKNPRMYKTGDLCRWLPDGQIEYLGRLDHQIKLRGFRIELGEIEAVLAEHPGVQQSLVMAREDSPGLKRLVAYLVPKTQAPPSNDELAAHLKQRLPEFMIPSAFVTLAAIPLTPNGKVDRKALPAPEYEERGERTAPRNPTEEVVAGVWAEVLHVKNVSVEDNFFELGGHSLLATQVISRLRQAFQIELPLRAVFEAPTVAGLAALIAGTKQTPQAPPLRSAPRSERLPLSFAQQRLWFLNQLEPNNPLYNIPVAIGMSGTLDFDALVRALDEIVRRHEVLRTTFAISGNQPIQVIAPRQHVEVPIISLEHLPADQQQSEVKRLAIEGAREIFDLETGPLFRAKLLRLREDEHVLLLNMHHIVSDGWSMWQFIREIAPLYGAFIEGKPSPLPELQIQYADFAVWQREWMSGDVLDQHLAYWTKQLQSAPGVFELPSDRVRPAVQTYRGATLTRKFPLELLQRLRTVSQSEGATLFMTLLAAYQTLLFRYTGQEDMVVGSPIAGRNRTEIESLIGFFVNAIVLRTDLSGSPTFRELLQRVRTVALDAYAHQELPFEKLVETLQPDRDLTRTPIFQVWFVLQNAPRADFKLQGVDLRSLDVHNGTSKFDLGLFVVEKPDGLHCMVEYSTDLFDASTIERFLTHYRVLLEAIAENPNRSIAEFPILDESERHQVVVEWNRTQVEYPRDRCLHQLIEEQVEQAPDAPALIFESQQLTYRELNARANQLAHRLRKHGVGPDTLVGVCAERSVEMVIALLGTMKAGGAYMPLDPDHPRERLAMVLEDASPAVLLTQEKLLEVLPSQNAPVICLDRDWSEIANEPASNPVCITSGKDQAYAIFTSGSTGRPKGVPNVHEGIVNRLLWMQHAYRLDSSDRVLQKTPYSFDVSVWEFFWPLLTGACLVVAKPEGHKDPNYLIDVIARNHITTMHFVPSMLRVFLESDGVERCTSLRRVICSGEALPMDLQVRFFERCKAELHNLYGPTEASVDVTYWQCVPEDHHTTVPIGRPIWNTQIYILDSRLQPVPIGVPGELHIGGVGLARGYLNRPQLTAEKFISDPFSREPGARLYKTGDLARFLDDGTIEYLGRLDHQVKIRGFRIELGEIEAALNAHGAVQQTIVIAREDEPGDKRLAAYIVVNPDYQGSSEDASADMVSTEQVSQWAMTFDEAYTRGESVEDATFNIKGWNSSYTGEAIPAEEMRVWVNTTVDRILALHPQRIWEIGCGTGLLLFRIAPKTSYFRGTDISQRALDFLRQQLSRPDLHLPQVQLARSAAHEFGDERESFDTIVLNSVIQYFPNLEYLVRVLTGASNSLGNNGRIFIGDVRNFPLLETFHASVELFRASDSASCKEVWDRAQKNLKQEGELVVDPDFFLTLSQRIPQIRRVEIHLKRGHAQNELTRFRYDVVLHVGEAGIPEANCHWLDWNKDVTTIDALRDLLTKSDSDFVGVTSLPNSRLWRESSAVQMLTSGGFATIGDLRNQLERDHAPSIELEELWDLENSLPFTIELRWGRKAPATCDILFRRKHPAGASSSQVVKFPGEPATARPLHTYATNPLRQRFTGTLTAELKRDLANTLPEYMVPAHFVLLDSMPLSPNGKVDRKQLPAPDRKSDAAGNYIAPHTPTEQILASIWAEVLRIEAIGIQDNFFDLGGHSLSATRVVARVRQAFAVDLPLRKLFETPTIAELANAIEDMKRTEMTEAPPMVRASREQQLPLSFAQQRLWFLDQMDPGNWLYNIPRAIRLSGKLYVSAMKSALNGLIQRHEILRTTYHTVDDHPVQIIAPKLEIDLPVLDLSTLPTSHREAKARDIVQKESAKGFALATDPMLRGLIIKLDEQDHVLFLNTHHIASDGWSTGVMMNDLAELYRAALENRASELPELNIQYADYACWQRNWLQGEVLAKQAAYWKSRLEGAPPVLSIPPDHSRPAVQDFSGSVFESVVPKSLVAGLRVLGRQQGTTMFMTMLAAFKTLLHHYTSQTDIVIGTDLANRATVETEALIGFFVNLLVLRTDLSGNPTFEELASRVREVSLNAYAHQDLPFDKLVEELSPERSLSHSPIVQVLFVQQNTPRAVDSMPGLKTSSFKLDVPAKFDVAAFVNEGENEATIRWVYNSSLFNQGTIARMAANYELLVRTIIVDPTLRLESLRELLAHHEKQHRGTEQKKFAEAGLEKLKKTRRKSVAEI